MPEPINGQQSDANGAPANPTTNPTDGMSETEQAAYWRQQAKLWQDKHNGLTGHVKTLTTERDALKLEKDTLVTDYTTEVSTLRQERATFQAQNTAFSTQIEVLTGERDTLAKRGEVGTLIRREFPVLEALYEEGLLNDVVSMPDDKRTEYLTKYQATLGGMANTQVKTNVQGSTPTQPQQRTGSTVTLDGAKTNMQNAIRQHGVNSQQYTAAYNEYLALLTNPAQ